MFMLLILSILLLIIIIIIIVITMSSSLPYCCSSEDPMDTILQGKFTNYNHEDRDYPSVQSIKKVGYLPDPRPTVASLAVIHAREKKEEQAKPKHFIMKKFQNVKGETSH